MIRLRKLFWLLCILTHGVGYAQITSRSLQYQDGNVKFEWDMQKDLAKVLSLPAQTTIWSGSLLPSFWIKANNKKQFIKVTVTGIVKTGNDETALQFRLELYGKGKLMIESGEHGILFRELQIEWTSRAPAIISMYFGASVPDPEKNSVWPSWDKPFMPDWQAAGFCVPGAKEGPAQSYFRNWDFGQANIALGSFGPSSGSPYGAAFPRPLLYAGMGNDNGFIALGAGSIPDGAMSLRVQSARGCIEYEYDEDIWGASQTKKRTWKDPLRLAIGENAWEAFQKYYNSFPVKPGISGSASNASWNTWGMWKEQQYVIEPVTNLAKVTDASLLVLDGSWEASMGSGEPNRKRFPHFTEDIAYVRNKGLIIGAWQSVGWLADPFAHGLTTKDLIVNRYGKPCKANWNFDPWSESYYCLDPSSENARQFIRKRTIQIMKILKPKLLKLDFGYGLPAPFMGVPRDSKFRGEKYAYELVNLIAQAAKSIDPDVAIMYYGISPLWTPLEDLVSLDDQGDLWYDIGDGHASWSIWASLLANTNTAISGSSGYDWDKDDETILNTCILGIPGAVLPVLGNDGKPASGKYINRRVAINKWFRKTTNWEPLWLNSHTGNFTGPPHLNCWGRLEKKESSTILTALVLRTKEKGITDERVGKIKWSGRWALIAQDNSDIFSSHKLALIPFDSGYISIPLAQKPGRIYQVDKDGSDDFKNWEWEQGVLTIRITSDMLENTAGFLLE